MANPVLGRSLTRKSNMTIIRGVRIVAAPCCGARYAAPRYVSMNFMAFEYWTDGWRDGSLMPNDEGLRHCKCGRFVLMKDLVEIESAETGDLPRIEYVPDELLPECIAKAETEDIEVAARLGYWRHLNHPLQTEVPSAPGCGGGCDKGCLGDNQPRSQDLMGQVSPS